MTTVNAYVNYNGRCQEAMNFYKENLGGELNIMLVGDTPLKEMCPPAMANQVAHAMLVKGSFVLMGTDMTPPEGYTKGNDIALSVNCSSEEEINDFYNKLSAGGKIIDPMKQQFWGALFGVVADKFGIVWMLSFDKNMQQ